MEICLPTNSQKNTHKNIKTHIKNTPKHTKNAKKKIKEKHMKHNQKCIKTDLNTKHTITQKTHKYIKTKKHRKRT